MFRASKTLKRKFWLRPVFSLVPNLKWDSNPHSKEFIHSSYPDRVIFHFVLFNCLKISCFKQLLFDENNVKIKKKKRKSEIIYFIRFHSWMHIFLILAKWGVCVRHFCLPRRVIGWEKPLHSACKRNMECNFTLKNAWETPSGSETWVFGRQLLENEWSEAVTSRKTIDSVCC